MDKTEDIKGERNYIEKCDISLSNIIWNDVLDSISNSRPRFIRVIAENFKHFITKCLLKILDQKMMMFFHFEKLFVIMDF